MSNLNLNATLPILERSLEFFRPHHQELRQRLITVFLCIGGCTAVAYFFAEKIAMFFIRPLFLANPLVYKLVYTNLPEAFLAYIKLALLVGILLSSPVIVWQSWRFIAPGLKKEEKRLAVVVVFWATLLFSGGVCFSYYVVLPKMLTYFMSYASQSLEPLPKLSTYLTFVARTMITFGAAFQIPFLMVMTGKAGFFGKEYFTKNRVYFYIAIATLAFLLAAGDLMATLLLTIPLLLLYEGGIVLCRIFARAKK